MLAPQTLPPCCGCVSRRVRVFVGLVWEFLDVHEAVHVLYVSHAPSTQSAGQGAALHGRMRSPGQEPPCWAAVRILTELVCVPSPQDLVQAPHGPNSCAHGTGHSCVLHSVVSVVASAHATPLNCGAVCTRVLVVMPPLHELLHTDPLPQSPQTPSIGQRVSRVRPLMPRHERVSFLG